MAKGVTIYTFFNGSYEEAFGSLIMAEKAAKRMQRNIRKDGAEPEPVEVNKCETVPLTKANFTAMFDDGTGPNNWCVSRKVVKVID